MRVAIIGAGTIFPSHAEAYREIGRDISVVADIDRKRAEAAARQFGVPHVCTDWHELLDREDVDVIDICTPPKFHREVAVAALANGKHVVCEKPLAGNLAEADEILQADRKSTGKLLAVHQLRCHPFFQRLQWLVREGHLGKVHFARVQRYDPPPRNLVDQGVWGHWGLAGGGVLMTKAIHQLDMLLGLLGPARRVQGMMGTFLCPIESEDHITANIEFESGAIANVTVSGQPYGGYGQHFDLFGDKASVGQPWHLCRADGSPAPELVEELQRQFPEPATPPTSGWKYLVRRVGWKLGKEFFPVKGISPHAPLFRAFFHALETNSPVPVSAEEGRAAVELCTAIYESALTGETVELPLDSSSQFYRGICKNDYTPAKIST